MRTKLRFLKVACLAMLITSTLGSFSVPEKSLFGACTWYANKGPIAYAYITDGTTMYSQSGIAQGTDFFGGPYYWPTSYEILTQINAPHPAGTLTIWVNGTLLKTYTIPANNTVGIVIEDVFPWPNTPGTPSAAYEVFWN